MSIPTELVGSLPRPMKLQQAYADHDEGTISWEQLVTAQDNAAADSIRRHENQLGPSRRGRKTENCSENQQQDGGAALAGDFPLSRKQSGNEE